MNGSSRCGWEISFTDNRFAYTPRTMSKTSGMQSGIAISNEMKWSEIYENKYRDTVRSRSWSLSCDEYRL